MKLFLLLFLPICGISQTGGSADGPRIDSLVNRINTLERELSDLRWSSGEMFPKDHKFSQSDSIHISKIVWWKVMQMIYPGDGMIMTEGMNISINWMYAWLPRRLRKRFEKANRLGKYHKQISYDP